MLSEDVMAFLRERPGGMLCTRDAENHPAAHECFLAEITAGHLIGLVPEHLARKLEENVADNGSAALVVSRIPGDHRSVQLKGRITSLEAARPRQEEFAPTIAPLLPLFAQFMPADAARVVLDKLSRGPVFRLQFDVTQVFDQSPGPKAGRPIEEGGA